MTTNRGLTVPQAKALAADPTTPAGVLARLANTYPETWQDLLRNPSIYPELRHWVEQAVLLAEREKFERQADTNSQPAKQQKVRVSVPSNSKKTKIRGRRKHGRILKSVAVFFPAALTIWALVIGVTYLAENEPPKGNVFFENLTTEPVAEVDWKYPLAPPGADNCAQFELVTLDQDLAVVLTQNDIETKRCRELESPVASTLALVDLSNGKEAWKVDLEDELDWTGKWKKQLVELPGLNEIIVKFIDVNGSDAGDGIKAVDKGDDRKMKTIVPFSRLNGRITDPVIAKSKSQPIMQAPVLNVIPIPGNYRSILVMTNGAKEDFRYAKYRSKRLSSPIWNVESDLRPVGGTQIVGKRLILGRQKDDTPTALHIDTGKYISWNGKSASKIYRIKDQYIQITGDGVSNKATNLESQGGPGGNEVAIDAIDLLGNTQWNIETNGYAISKDETISTLTNRRWYSELFVFDGKDNRYISRVDVDNGTSLWRTKLPQSRFEIGRTSSANAVGVYYFEKLKTETKKAGLLNLADGTLSDSFKISGKQVRIDGSATDYSILVDEPERSRIVKAAESGSKPNSQHKDGSKDLRACLQAVSEATGQLDWKYECNGNQHVIRAGGRWLLVDLSSGTEEFWPITRRNK
jgi:outer membrane protein assembly factor BamB